jgi:hypothetical protein
VYITYCGTFQRYPRYGILSFLLNFNSDFSLSLSLSQVHVKSLRPTPAIVESFV